jgi:hypothetical protein
MNNKSKDILIWIGVLLTLGLLIFLVTREFFLVFASEIPLLGGFVKFFFLASYGDLIALRIKSKYWRIPVGFFYKALVWGIIGVFIVMIFSVYAQGVAYLQASAILPFKESAFMSALFISVLMNFTFAPTMMTVHRISDSYIENRMEDGTLKDAIHGIDFVQFFKFTVCRTIPFFWVPAHTITFLLPEQYRIIFAAVLGIFLGLLLGLFNSKKKEEAQYE